MDNTAGGTTRGNIGPAACLSPSRRWSRSANRSIGLALIVLLAAVSIMLLGSAGPASAKDWSIEKVDVLLDVQPNGDVLVDENITFAFSGNFHFVTRSIPTRNLAGLTDIDVRQNGVSLSQGSGAGMWQTSTKDGRRLITLHFDLTDTSATWTLRYRAVDAVQFLDSRDELRWHVFDAETPVTIGDVSARVKLPGQVPSADLKGLIDTGSWVTTSVNSRAPSTIDFSGKDIGYRTKFWIVAGFPKGVVALHWTPRRALAFAVPKAGFGLPIFALLAMLLIWMRRGRDRPQGAYASYLAEPPSDLAPALAGALVDERVDVKEMVATVVDLARRGYVDMADSRTPGLSLSKRDTTFRRLKPLSDLNSFEHQVGLGLFATNGETATSEELSHRFYSVISPFCAAVYEEAAKAGLFVRNPQRVRRRWMSISILLFLALVACGVVFAVWNIAGWGFWLGGSLVASLMVGFFARVMPQRTARGAQEQRKWVAFRDYLRDLQRFQDMATARDTFERYLPYAIAFGVEREWMRRFGDVQVEAPGWYHPLPVSGEPMGGAPMVAADGPSLGGLTSGLSLSSISDSLFGSLSHLSDVITSGPETSGSSSGAFGSSTSSFESSDGGSSDFDGGGGGGDFDAG